MTTVHRDPPEVVDLTTTTVTADIPRVVVEPEPEPEPDPDSAPAPVGAPAQRVVLAAVGIAVTTLAALILGFLVYLFAFSSVQEAHNQLVNYNSLRGKLDGATAPVGPVAAGTPVALLDAPTMGLHHAVVVQGTSPGNLMQGPGLRSDTPLPGEAGVSVMYGRRTTFGHPFGKLNSLQVGDMITTTTGHGVAHYRVTMFSKRGQPVHDTAPNRLVLVTADSSFVPEYAITASAVLVGNPQPDDGGYQAVGSAEQELAGDSSGILVLMMWSLALVAVAAAGTLAGLLWSRWPAWLLAAPVLLAVVWNIYENAAHLLPNLL